MRTVPEPLDLSSHPPHAANEETSKQDDVTKVSSFASLSRYFTLFLHSTRTHLYNQTMSSFNAVESDQTAPRNLQISAAIANQPPPHSPRSATTATSGATNIATTATGIVKSNAASNTKEAKLPPSPLVTPPMNPSQAAPYQAISPRSLDPAAATVPTAGKPSSPPPPNLHQQHQQQQQHAHPGAKGVPHVYHDYSKLSGPGPAYIRKKTGGVTQRKYHRYHIIAAWFLSYSKVIVLAQAYFSLLLAFTSYSVRLLTTPRTHSLSGQTSRDALQGIK